MIQEIKSKAPLSGYAIERVYTLDQSLKAITNESLPLPSESDVRVGWDWRHLKPTVLEVKLLLGLDADTSHPFWAWVETVGTFHVIGSPKVPIEEFVKLQAVAILLPYARQYLANLTVNTLAGAWHLPSIDVQAMMAQFDPEKTTGARQTREGKLFIPPPAATTVQKAPIGKKARRKTKAPAKRRPLKKG